MILIQQWVKVASLYVEEKSEIWFESYMCNRESVVNWDEFSRAVCNRFGNKDDVVEEFNKLVHESSVNEYVKKFEELKSFMHDLNSLLPKFFSFVSGLKEDLKHMLKILKPISLMTSFKQAKCRKNQTML